MKEIITNCRIVELSPDFVAFGGLSVHVTLKHLNLLLWCIGEPSKMGLPLPISLSVVNIWPLERRLSSLFFWMRLVYCLRITEEISLFPYFQQCVCVCGERGSFVACCRFRIALEKKNGQLALYLAQGKRFSKGHGVKRNSHICMPRTSG